MDFGRTLQQARTAKEMTQKELATVREREREIKRINVNFQLSLPLVITKPHPSINNMTFEL